MAYEKLFVLSATAIRWCDWRYRWRFVSVLFVSVLVSCDVSKYNISRSTTFLEVRCFLKYYYASRRTMFLVSWGYGRFCIFLGLRLRSNGQSIVVWVWVGVASNRRCYLSLLVSASQRINRWILNFKTLKLHSQLVPMVSVRVVVVAGVSGGLSLFLGASVVSDGLSRRCRWSTMFLEVRCLASLSTISVRVY